MTCTSDECMTPTYTHATDVSECQKICQEIDGCKAFVFNQARNPPTCNLKNIYEMQLAVKGQKKTYGPKYCQGIKNLKDIFFFVLDLMY